MSSQIRSVFGDARIGKRAVFIAYITAGYPTPESTIPILLNLQKNGADIIELGIPFSDAIADGPTIQEANYVAIGHNVCVATCLRYVEEARKAGLSVPVILMGYYNPILNYGEENLMVEAGRVGVNGFIVVDLPPEENSHFRTLCLHCGLSFVPLLAPSTPESRVVKVTSNADSFVYVVSKMGVTGQSWSLNTDLPAIIKRIRRHTLLPLAVGFGVSSAEHFKQVAEHADGVVIGSKILNIVSAAKDGPYLDELERFLRTIQSRKENICANIELSIGSDLNDCSIHIEKIEACLERNFGNYGGQFVSEALRDCLRELEEMYLKVKDDSCFWKEFRSHYDFMGRPSKLQLAEGLSKECNGARIWLKREDLNHTGSHKINNALGQVLLARRLGKTRIIAETGAGQHGVATATVCAKFGLKCTIYMGEQDCDRQSLNVFRMKMLGAEVVPVASGTQTLKDAINDAMRDWVSNLESTYYLIGSALGPHPFPTIVRDMQAVIGNECKEQFMAAVGHLPDAVVACVGGGSNAIGMFHAFVEHPQVKLIGAEAGGDGVETGRHGASLTAGTVGVLHGTRTLVLQDPSGQIIDTHSISAGLDYPGVGPEHAWLKERGRGEYVAVTDRQALLGLKKMAQLEGIIPALETAHAVYTTMERAKEMRPDQHIVLCVSGRGDKDMAAVVDAFPAFNISLTSSAPEE